MWTVKTDQTRWMPRLVCVTAGCSARVIGVVMKQLINRCLTVARFLGLWKATDVTLTVGKPIH